MKFQPVSTRRVAPGYYKFEYKGYSLSITGIPEFKQWYFQLGDEPANDWHSSKLNAVLAAIEYIDYLVGKNEIH